MKNATRQEFDNHRFLSDPGCWPCWPVCPVKRYEPGRTWPRCGVVWVGTSIVLEVDLFSIHGMNFEQAQKKAGKVYEYEDVSAMIADGWVVD